ncbi:MAG: hypothetical protein CVU12_02875 [Bacteroidetes bacterium HGW-Bacteroidetes-7]|nr:MAG: hypothetical protein CVU12_02875 [Bacteroidetes bacterium HGW-Bacteroidetes-7]
MVRHFRTVLVFVYILLLAIMVNSCVKIPDMDKIRREIEETISVYKYPYKDEAKDIVAEIIIQTDGSINANLIETEIPPLKFNKSWLFMLTQDDCKHDAFSSMWASINGKPLSPKHYYDIAHLLIGDLPPDIFSFGKTLGSTDGTGNVVRFSFTTTVSPQWQWMDAKSIIKKNSTNLSRFKMKSGLTWNNLVEMLNFGTSIAFHDFNTKAVDNPDSILCHFNIAQNIINDKLSGRVCKVLAEPNGNKNYIYAANNYTPICIMTAQSEVETLYPYKISSALNKNIIGRGFYTPAQVQNEVIKILALPKEDRPAFHVGVHGAGMDWPNLLLWLNDTYGKDGADDVWMTSLEEYFEYNNYRARGTIDKVITGNTIRLQINLPMEPNSYYPSITLNVKGITKENITSLTSSATITGLSYGNYDAGLMINIDFRKFLSQLATHYVERYEKNKNSHNLSDARYFVAQLKESEVKKALQNRLK